MTEDDYIVISKRKKNPLDKKNVRNLFGFLNKALKEQTEEYLFEPNDRNMNDDKKSGKLK